MSVALQGSLLDGIDEVGLRSLDPAIRGSALAQSAWHLGQVQWCWGTIVGRGLTMEAEVAALERPPRPVGVTSCGCTSRQPATICSRTCAVHLRTHQRGAGPTSRRSGSSFADAHEALIHRLDAELTMGERTPMDAGLSTDGVDEALGFIGSGAPPWDHFLPEPAKTIQVRTSDTDRSCQLSGTDDGRQHDEPCLQVVASDCGTSDASQPAAATISGTAADLDCLLWDRPTMGQIQWAGDPLVLDRLKEIIAHAQD